MSETIVVSQPVIILYVRLHCTLSDWDYGPEFNYGEIT